MKNILTKSLGSNTAINMVNATMEGLEILENRRRGCQTAR